MKLQASERDIKRQINAYLKKIPGLKHVAYSPYPHGEAGTPDILGCINGHMFLLEVKSESNVPTKLQEQRIEEWTRAGAIVSVVHSIKDVKKLFEGE